MFVLFLYVVCCFRLVFLSFCIYNQTNTYNNKRNHNNSKENKQTKKNINLPARPLEIFICRGGSWAGNTVFMLFCCFPLSCYVCFVSFCCLLFSPSLFKLLHLQSKKHI